MKWNYQIIIEWIVGEEILGGASLSQGLVGVIIWGFESNNRRQKKKNLKWNEIKLNENNSLWYHNLRRI